MSLEDYLEKLAVIEQVLADIKTSNLSMEDTTKLVYARAYLKMVRKQLKESIE